MDIKFRWGGKDVTVRPTHRLYREIESEVSLARIANTLSTAAVTGDSRDVPMSHLSFILCKLLRAGGVHLSEMDVHASMFDDGNDYGVALRELLGAYYGAGPESAPGNVQAGPTKKRATRK